MEGKKVKRRTEFGMARSQITSKTCWYFYLNVTVTAFRDDAVYNLVYENGENKSEEELKNPAEAFFGDGKPITKWSPKQDEIR